MVLIRSLYTSESLLIQIGRADSHYCLTAPVLVHNLGILSTEIDNITWQTNSECIGFIRGEIKDEQVGICVTIAGEEQCNSDSEVIRSLNP